MKCPNCGSNLTIDDEKCSFCGETNPFAAKHRREMKHFTREFNRTKVDVMRTSKQLHYWAVKITLIAVLVAVNIAMLFFITNSYDVERFFQARKIEANYKTHAAKLNELEKNRQYIALSQYYNVNKLYYSDRLKEYDSVVQMCNSYSYIYEYIMQIVTEKETEYYTFEDRLEFISEQFDYVYKYCKPREYSDQEQYKPQHQECMDDLVAQLEDIIQTYFGISDEEMEAFPSLSKARRQILLEEGLKQYE